MKLGLSLTKYRVQKKIVRSIGVRFASEQKKKDNSKLKQCVVKFVWRGGVLNVGMKTIVPMISNKHQ